MFILRSTGVEGSSTNEILGIHYDLVSSDCKNFKETYTSLNLSPEAKIENCKGIILCGRAIPLWNTMDYYVMTESGKTFAKL